MKRLPRSFWPASLGSMRRPGTNHMPAPFPFLIGWATRLVSLAPSSSPLDTHDLPQHSHRRLDPFARHPRPAGRSGRPAPGRLRLGRRRQSQGRDRACLGRRPGLLAHLSAQAGIGARRQPGHDRNPPAVGAAAAGPVRLPARLPAQERRSQRQALSLVPPRCQPWRHRRACRPATRDPAGPGPQGRAALRRLAHVRARHGAGVPEPG